MAWYDSLLQIFGKTPQPRTPPYAPQGPTQNGTMGSGGAPATNAGGSNIPWGQISGAAAGLGSAYLQSRSQGQQNQRLDARTQLVDQLAADEQKRRDYYASILMPSILRGLGQKNPQVLAGAQRGLMGTPNPYATGVPPTQQALIGMGTQTPPSYGYDTSPGMQLWDDDSRRT